MIRINKGTRIPRKLTKDGQESIRHTCAQYDSDPEAFSSGTSKLPSPKPAIYGHPSVKKELLDRQNQKCCFCEVKFAGDYGDVEHFRPKGCVIDIKTKQKQYPGYYWLAYDWDNLFVCKEILNRSFKRNYFPLSDDSSRAKSHHDNIADETPLLIDPAKDDPRDHIRFHEDEAIAHRNSIKGRITIDLINLNHEQIIIDGFFRGHILNFDNIN